MNFLLSARTQRSLGKRLLMLLTILFWSAPLTPAVKLCVYHIWAHQSITDKGGYSADLGDHAGTQITYKVALPAGEKVILSLVNAAGDEAWSSEVSQEKKPLVS